MIRQIKCDGKAEYDFLKELAKRSGETDRKVTEIVTEIIDTVREGGDEGTPIALQAGHPAAIEFDKIASKLVD